MSPEKRQAFASLIFATIVVFFLAPQGMFIVTLGWIVFLGFAGIEFYEDLLQEPEIIDFRGRTESLIEFAPECHIYHANGDEDV